MARTETLRIVSFDDDTRELIQEIRQSIREHRAYLNEVEKLLDNFMRIATFDIFTEITEDGPDTTFTFADLG